MDIELGESAAGISGLMSSGAFRGGPVESTRNPRVTRSRKRIKVKGAKRVKVSFKLKRKIQQVTESAKVHGYFQDNRIDLCDPGAFAGGQNVERLPNRTLTFGGYLFNYDRVLHAASRLWNGKAGNISPSIFDPLNFNPNDTVIHVNKQWWTFRMRNNSTRTSSIRVYKCQSKNAVQNADALVQWTAGIQQMGTDGQLIASTPALSVNTLHTGPTIANQFRKAYKTETITIHIQPGQEYSFSVNGPTMVYRGQDFYDANTYRPIQKQDIQLLWVSNVDMVGTHNASADTLGAYGYAPDTSVAVTPAQQQLEKVYVESTYHCNLSLPEKVGGVLQSNVIGSLFQNGNRVRRTCIDEFGATTGFLFNHRRDEMNPIQEDNPT